MSEEPGQAIAVVRAEDYRALLSKTLALMSELAKLQAPQGNVARINVPRLILAQLVAAHLSEISNATATTRYMSVRIKK